MVTKKPTKKSVKKAVTTKRPKYVVVTIKGKPILMDSSKIKESAHRREAGKNIGNFGMADLKAGYQAFKSKVSSGASAVAGKVSSGASAVATRTRQAMATRNANKALETTRINNVKRKYQADLADYNRKLAIYNSRPAAVRSRLSPPVKPADPDLPLTTQWKDAAVAAGRGAKQLATPKGIGKVAKGAWDGTARVMNDVQDGWDAHKKLKEKEMEARQAAYDALPEETKMERLRVQAQAKENRLKIQQMRDNYQRVQEEQLTAQIEGRTYNPKYFKVPGGFGEDDKFVDEFGNELSFDPTHPVSSRSGRSSRMPRRNEQREEMEDLGDLLGASFRSSRNAQLDRERYQPEPQSREIDTSPMAMMPETPRRRVHRGEFPIPYQPQTFTQPQLMAPKRRTAQSDEIDELREFKKNEKDLLNQLMSGY